MMEENNEIFLGGSDVLVYLAYSDAQIIFHKISLGQSI